MSTEYAPLATSDEPQHEQVLRTPDTAARQSQPRAMTPPLGHFSASAGAEERADAVSDAGAARGNAPSTPAERELKEAEHRLAAMQAERSRLQEQLVASTGPRGREPVASVDSVSKRPSASAPSAALPLAADAGAAAGDPDEQRTTEAALEAWKGGVAKQVKLLELESIPELRRDFALLAKHSSNAGKAPADLLDLAEATARATVEIRERVASATIGRGDGGGITGLSSSANEDSEPARYSEHGWMEAVDEKHKREAHSDDDSSEEGEQEDDEIALALECCPRLHLLTIPRLVGLLHMTDPQELNDRRLWKSMCNFDRVVLADSSASAEAKFGEILPRKVSNDVVAVEQCDKEGNVVATLRLHKPYAQIFQHDLAAGADELKAPQAAWVAGLFDRITETLQAQLERVLAAWRAGTDDGDDDSRSSRHLCDMLQTDPDGGNAQDVDKCCFQVALVAFNIRISDILGELLDADGETEARQKRHVEAWDQALEVAKAESKMLLAARTKTPEEATLQATLLEGLSAMVGGSVQQLAKKLWRIRYWRVGKQVQVAMRVVGDSKQWRGCSYGWELLLQGSALAQTTCAFDCYETHFQNMPAIARGALIFGPDTGSNAGGHLHTKTSFQGGQAGTGKMETAKDYARWIIGACQKQVGPGCTDADLEVYSKAQAHHPFVLLCDEVQRTFSEGAVRAAMRRQRVSPGSLILAFNPNVTGSVDMAKLKNETIEHEMGSVAEMTLPFLAKDELEAFFVLKFPASRRVAAAMARFFAAGAAARNESAMSAANTLTGDNRFFNLRFIGDRFIPMVNGKLSDAGTEEQAAIEIFRFLGEHFTIAPTARQKTMNEAAGGGKSPEKHMMSVLGEVAASRRYHERLIAAVYSSRSDGGQEIDTMLDQQLAAGRRIHAADLTALLCEFPDSAVRVIRKIGLQQAEAPVSVGWAGTRRVPISYTAVHISPSGERAEGPAMLWAGKDAAGLLGEVELDQPERTLTAQVVGFDGAITTLELLPAIIESPVSAELLTCPAMDAVLLAKWELLKPWWAVEVGIFVLVFGLYLAHALVEDEGLQAYLVAAASVSTLPLFAMEWRQYRAGSAMSGVGNGRLSKRIEYLDIYQGVDLLGLSLVCATGVVSSLDGRHPTLIAFTVLLLCWKLILFMRINPTMGFLMATLIECMGAIKFFLLVLALAVSAFSLSFNLQMQTVDASSATSSSVTGAAEPLPAYGAPGMAGMQRSLWATFLFTILGDFNSDTFWEGGVTTIISFLLITTIVNIIMLNVLIAIVGQAQDAVREKGDATYAHMFADTLAGLDAIHPRVRRKAFSDDDEDPAHKWKQRTGELIYNEVQYWLTPSLVKRAFGEPRAKRDSDSDDGAGAVMALRDTLATVHVLSASYHPENEGAWKWSADKADKAEADKAKADKAKAKSARFDELEAKITGELAELRQELRKKDESEREMKAMLEKLLNLHGASVTG
jgi:hypothetical protein